MRTIILFILLISSQIGYAQTEEPTTRPEINVVCLLVKDYDEALAFYTEKLGFEIAMDRSFGENQRWVSIKLPDSSLELSLGLASTAEDLEIVGRQGGQFPFFVIQTPDFENSYHQYHSKEVEFLGQPQKNPWGTTATFKDLYGNIILLRGNQQ
jgi:catechol 2,3-dioxygenase-like lactoylglutathione lyase family enzyme